MHSDYLKIKSAYLEHASGRDYYNKNKRTISSGSKAGMPSSVPSYYRGKSNVSSSTVNDSGRYAAYQDFMEKLTKYNLELGAITAKVKEAKPYYDAYPGLVKEQERLQKLVDRYEQQAKNTRSSTAQKNAQEGQIRTNKGIESAKRIGEYATAVALDTVQNMLPSFVPRKYHTLALVDTKKSENTGVKGGGGKIPYRNKYQGSHGGGKM